MIELHEGLNFTRPHDAETRGVFCSFSVSKGSPSIDSALFFLNLFQTRFVDSFFFFNTNHNIEEQINFFLNADEILSRIVCSCSGL
jgi:hypothetical protein